MKLITQAPLSVNKAIFQLILLVFNTCFESVVYRSQVICNIHGIIIGVLSISAAMVRFELEETSPLDSSTTVSYSCSMHVIFLARTIR
jgi:hypothetical protein